MTRTIALLLVTLAFTFCASQPPVIGTNELIPSQAPDASVAQLTPIAVATPSRPTPSVEPAPSSAEPVPSAEPASSTTEPTLVASPPPTPPDLQAAALLPEFAADVAAGISWDRYLIDVELDPDRLTLSGKQQLELTNQTGQVLEEVYFHLYPNLPDLQGSLNVSSAAIGGVPVEPTYAQNGVLMRLGLPQPLLAGARTTIDLTFTTVTPANASASAYGGFNYEAGVWSLASFYPVLAVYGANGWDVAPVSLTGDLVNSGTSLYQVRIRAPADWVLITTGVPVADERSDSAQTVTFVSGPQRDFYLAAQQGLDQISANAGGVRVTSYYKPGNAEGGQQALDAAIRALEIFSRRFGPYPLAEFEVVEFAATRFLGVEYPGVVLIEQSLYDGGEVLETTVAHEVAHQWWYSLVGNNVQQEAWLDEAMASYAQVIYYEEVAGPAAVERELNEFRGRYREALENGDDTVVAQPTADFSGAAYFWIVYGKAALFLHALRLEIGEEAFDQFLHSYYAGQRYGLAEGSEFLATAETSCACELEPLYEAWITSVQTVEIP